MNSDATLWARWTVASAAGMLLGALPRALLGRDLIGFPPAGQILVLCLMGAWMGACIGIAQWLVLRPVLPHAERWATATAAGWAVGSLVGGAFGWGAAVGAVLSGILQWRILKAHFPHAHLWLLAIAVDWVLAVDFLSPGLPRMVFHVLPPGRSYAGLLVGSLSYALLRGVVAGGVTGAALFWMQRSGNRALPLAKVALRCGIASWVWQIGGFGLTYLWSRQPDFLHAFIVPLRVAVPLALVAIVAGCTAIAAVRRGEAKPTSRGPAVGALLLGASYLVVFAVLVVAMLAMIAGISG